MSSTSGSWRRTRANPSICCWPPEVLAARCDVFAASAGKSSSAASIRRQLSAGSRVRVGAHLEVLQHGHGGKDGLAAGSI